jgi:hypothetical protein
MSGDVLVESITSEHYGVVARHLGQLNGTYLGDRERLGLPWLTRGWLAARRAPSHVLSPRRVPQEHDRETRRRWRHWHV